MEFSIVCTNANETVFIVACTMKILLKMQKLCENACCFSIFRWHSRVSHCFTVHTAPHTVYIYNANWKYVYKQQNSRIRVQASHSFKSIVFNIYCICAFLPTPKFSCNRYSTFSVVFGRNARSQAACLFDTPKKSNIFWQM